MDYKHTARGGDQYRAHVNMVMKNWVQLDMGQFIFRPSDSQKRYLSSEVFTAVLKEIKFSRDVSIRKLVNSPRFRWCFMNSSSGKR